MLLGHLSEPLTIVGFLSNDDDDDDGGAKVGVEVIYGVLVTVNVPRSNSPFAGWTVYRDD